MESKKPIVNFDELQELMEKEPDIAVFAPKNMVDKAEKEIEKKLSHLKGKATAIDTQINELKEMLKTIKSDDVSSYALAVKRQCDTELKSCLWSLEKRYKDTITEIEAEIRKKENELETLDPTAKYYAAIVGRVLDAVKQRGYELTSENATEIVCKSLDVASYQKWQEIKGENWGRNPNEKEKHKRII